MNTSSTPTFAIVSRFMTIDLPYMAQWFEYHMNLGISHFYLYYIDITFYDLETISGFPHSYITLQKIDRDTIPNNNDIFWMRPFCDPSIQETFLLHIDSDEFLYLNGLRLPEFVLQYPNIDCYYFSWMMAPSPRLYAESMQSILDDPKAPKYMIAEGRKVMGRWSKVQFAQQDTHRFDPRPDVLRRSLVQTKMDEPYMILHFSYRGIYDCYFKLFHQKMKTHDDRQIANKRAILSSSTRSFPLSQIPSRILCYAGELCNRNPKKMHPLGITMGITSTTNYDLLQRLLAEVHHPEEIELFVRRVKEICHLRLYHNALLPAQGIKNYLKTLSLYSQKKVHFSM
jgi:hypothetical protein